MHITKIEIYYFFDLKTMSSARKSIDCTRQSISTETNTKGSRTLLKGSNPTTGWALESVCLSEPRCAEPLASREAMGVESANQDDRSRLKNGSLEFLPHALAEQIEAFAVCIEDLRQKLHLVEQNSRATVEMLGVSAMRSMPF